MRIGRGLIGFALTGCLGTEPDSGTNDEAPEVEPANADGSILLGDENNYSFSGLIDAPTVSLQAGGDVGVDWSGLTDDIQCHPLDPVADIDNVALVWFRYLDEATVEEGISNNNLNQSEMSLYLSHEPGDNASFTLSQLLAFGATDPDVEQYFIPDSGAWMLLLTTGTTIAVGARMLAFLDPVANSASTMGSISDGCSVLDYSVELETLNPLGVLTDGPWLLDWSALTTTGQANAFVTTQVSEVMVARYESLDLVDLEADFLDIELNATDRYTVAHSSGTSADLSLLTHANDGSAFPGFAAEGTWIVALRCGLCASPAPLALSVLVAGG